MHAERATGAVARQHPTFCFPVQTRRIMPTRQQKEVAAERLDAISDNQTEKVNALLLGGADPEIALEVSLHIIGLKHGRRILS